MDDLAIQTTVENWLRAVLPVAWHNYIYWFGLPIDRTELCCVCQFTRPERLGHDGVRWVANLVNKTVTPITTRSHHFQVFILLRTHDNTANENALYWGDRLVLSAENPSILALFKAGSIGLRTVKSSLITEERDGYLYGDCSVVANFNSKEEFIGMAIPYVEMFGLELDLGSITVPSFEIP